ncbi:MAG TPA: biotin-dependent carboxyltransferase family protein [Candidatus Dormibacteraeota bacterium]
MTVLQVEKPGLYAAIQDLGRPGHRLSGVPPSGAMDRFALMAANRLVGNPEGAGALECMLNGPVLVAAERCLVAVTGADLDPRVNGQEAPTWTSFWLAEGDRLTFGGRRWGARCYLAVAGGLAGDRWLGSVATYQLVERGGIHGRPLKAGDQLALAAEPPRPAVVGRRLPERLWPLYSPRPELAAIEGPHFGRLSAAARRAFYGQTWKVSRNADRMGYRLEGGELEIKSPEMLSFGLAFGCVQLPPSGQPIILMADHQTAGGYPVVAGVARADLPLAAQLLPGEEIGFRKITAIEAQERWRALYAGLDVLR